MCPREAFARNHREEPKGERSRRTIVSAPCPWRENGASFSYRHKLLGLSYHVESDLVPHLWEEVSLERGELSGVS